MSTTPAAKPTSSPAPTTPASTGQDVEPSAGADERGTTTITDAVVAKVAGLAAREVEGIHAIGSGASRALSSVTQRVGLGDARSQGVAVEVGTREAAVDLTLIVDYGQSVPRVAQAVRDQITRRVEGITGLRVTEVNIVVSDLYFPGDDQPEEPVQPRVA